MGWFEIAGKNCLEFGIVISGGGTYSIPERQTKKIAVPGRNGDLLEDGGRWENTLLRLPATVAKNWTLNEGDIRSWLGACMRGYHRLVTSYHPNEYRMARFLGPLEVDTGFLCRRASFDISFDCKPQRYLVAGEVPISMTSAGVLLNPTAFESRPLIRVTCTGDGALVVAGTSYGLSSIGGSVTIDSELMDAWEGSVSANHKVSGYPVLPAGDCAISWSGGVSAVEITPRWWTI